MKIVLSDVWLGVYTFEVDDRSADEILKYLLTHKSTCKQIKEEE